MKNALILLSLSIIVLMTGCSTLPIEENNEEEIYLEGVDTHSEFTFSKLIDKESGCKYLVVKSSSRGDISVTQMINVDGKPLCSN